MRLADGLLVLALVVLAVANYLVQRRAGATVLGSFGRPGTAAAYALALAGVVVTYVLIRRFSG